MYVCAIYQYSRLIHSISMYNVRVDSFNLLTHTPRNFSAWKKKLRSHRTERSVQLLPATIQLIRKSIVGVAEATNLVLLFLWLSRWIGTWQTEGFSNGLWRIGQVYSALLSLYLNRKYLCALANWWFWNTNYLEYLKCSIRATTCCVLHTFSKSTNIADEWWIRYYSITWDFVVLMKYMTLAEWMENNTHTHQINFWLKSTLMDWILWFFFCSCFFFHFIFWFFNLHKAKKAN